MKLLHLLPLAAIANAFVIPDEQVLANIAQVEPESKVLSDYNEWFSGLKSAAQEAVESATESFNEFKDEASDYLDTFRPHHPPHHKPNLTLYEMIKKSKYTTILAKIVDDDDFLVNALNSTDTNLTVFAPIDSAFEKLPEHAKKYLKHLPKEDKRKIILYHVVPGLYPAGRVLRSATLPTLYNVDTLSKEEVPQRLAVGLDIRRGFGINYYSRLKAVNIFGTNGVAHAVDSLLLPPPKAIYIIKFLVSEFTSLNLALEKTGLVNELNDTSVHHGGTIFTPPESAWKLLGPKINGFLFSKPGLKYLKALLKYHIVPNHTLYTDAYYTADKGVVADPESAKGFYHLDLETALEGKSLSVDVLAFRHYTSIKINGFTRVTVPNGIASDGVFQDTSTVLIPPKKVDEVASYWMGEELTVEDLKERLEPYVENTNEEENWEL